MMDRYLAVPQISWNPLSLSSAFIQFDSLCGERDQVGGHQDTRISHISHAENIQPGAENIRTEHRTDAAADSRLGTRSRGRGGGSSGYSCSPWLGSSSRSHWRSHFYIRKASEQNHLWQKDKVSVLCSTGVEVRDLVSGRLMVSRSRYCLWGTSGVHSLEAAWAGGGAEGGVSLGLLERVLSPRPRPAQGRWWLFWVWLSEPKSLNHQIKFLE